MTKREVTHAGLDELKKPRGRSGLTEEEEGAGCWLLVVNDSSRGLEAPFPNDEFFYFYFALNFFVHPRRTEGKRKHSITF